MPYYNNNELKKFRKSLKSHSVIFINDTVSDAQYFSLNGENAISDFMLTPGFKCFSEECFINTKEWENNPDKSHKIMVDAYNFYIDDKTGYLAFMYNDKTKKWIIKSFKREEKLTDTYRPFEILLNKK